MLTSELKQICICIDSRGLRFCIQACECWACRLGTVITANITVCRKFQASGPFWGRHYVFWHNGKPLTLIYEVFNTALESYLGPCGSQ